MWGGIGHAGLARMGVPEAYPLAGKPITDPRS